MKRTRRQRTLFSFRLRNQVCDDCDFTCNPLKLIRCPACHQTFDSRTEIDLWEVYDECAICPACDRVVPAYQCYVVCPNGVTP